MKKRNVSKIDFLTNKVLFKDREDFFESWREKRVEGERIAFAAAISDARLDTGPLVMEERGNSNRWKMISNELSVRFRQIRGNLDYPPLEIIDTFLELY